MSITEGPTVQPQLIAAPRSLSPLECPRVAAVEQLDPTAPGRVDRLTNLARDGLAAA